MWNEPVRIRNLMGVDVRLKLSEGEEMVIPSEGGPPKIITIIIGMGYLETANGERILLVVRQRKLVGLPEIGKGEIGIVPPPVYDLICREYPSQRDNFATLLNPVRNDKGEVEATGIVIG